MAARIKIILAILNLFASNFVFAADIQLGSIPVSINLTSAPRITVEKPGGGWYSTLELTNSTGKDVTLYQVKVPVQVTTRNERDFRVSLVEPLSLVNQTDTTLSFINEQVLFGLEGSTPSTLSLQAVNFTNPLSSTDTSIGNYSLSIIAFQPEGSVKSISGKYIGKLVLLFEVGV